MITTKSDSCYQTREASLRNTIDFTSTAAQIMAKRFAFIRVLSPIDRDLELW